MKQKDEAIIQNELIDFKLQINGVDDTLIGNENCCFNSEYENIYMTFQLDM